MSKQTIFVTKKKVEKERSKDVENNTQTDFHIARQMKKENKDMSEKCICYDSGNLRGLEVALRKTA